MEAYEVVFQAVIGLTLLFALAVLLNNALWRAAPEPGPAEAPTVPIRTGMTR